MPAVHLVHAGKFLARRWLGPPPTVVGALAWLDAPKAQVETLSMRLFPLLALVSTIALVPSACGSSSSTGGSDDPRCAAVCAIEQPPIANAGDICSQASADKCAAQCDARIEGTTAACGDCLLEDATLGGKSSGDNSPECMSPSVKCGTDSECTASGPGGDCTYCSNDKAEQESCYVKTHPRREVECSPSFRDPVKCSALCAAK